MERADSQSVPGAGFLLFGIMMGFAAFTAVEAADYFENHAITLIVFLSVAVFAIGWLALRFGRWRMPRLKSFADGYLVVWIVISVISVLSKLN